MGQRPTIPTPIITGLPPASGSRVQELQRPLLSIFFSRRFSSYFAASGRRSVKFYNEQLGGTTTGTRTALYSMKQRWSAEYFYCRMTPSTGVHQTRHSLVHALSASHAVGHPRAHDVRWIIVRFFARAMFDMTCIDERFDWYLL